MRWQKINWKGKRGLVEESGFNMKDWIIHSAFSIYEFIYPVFGLSFLAIFFVIIPLGLFDKTRGFSALALFIASYIFGFGIWIYSVGLAFALWGWFWLIVGLLFFGVGVVFIAIIATLTSGFYDISLVIFITVVFVYGLRFLAQYLAEKDDQRRREAFKYRY